MAAPFVACHRREVSPDSAGKVELAAIRGKIHDRYANVKLKIGNASCFAVGKNALTCEEIVDSVQRLWNEDGRV
jgi:hypothetical protein